MERGACLATADLEHEQVPPRWPRERPRNGGPSRANGVPYFNALTVAWQEHLQVVDLELGQRVRRSPVAGALVASRSRLVLSGRGPVPRPRRRRRVAADWQAGLRRLPRK